MRTEAQEVIKHLKNDSIMYKLVLSLMGEKKSWEMMANELGNENVELRNRLEKAEYEYKKLRQDLKEWTEQS
jgi:hypothetical protein